MNRRQFLAATATLAAQPASRPNILFAIADDWGLHAGAYGTRWVSTPAFDRVAREGIVFKHAFVNAPSCTPCRSSLLSGRYFFNANRGAILSGAVWDSSIPSYPLMLRDAGYHIGKSYKVWSPGTPADAPFGGQAHAYEKAGRAPNNFSEEVTARVGRGMKLAAARAMETALATLNAELAAEGRPPLAIGVGINTARVVAGNLGNQLGSVRVAVAPLANFGPAYQVAIQVDQFQSFPGDAKLSGEARLSVVWTLKDPSGNPAGSGVFAAPAAGD